MNRVGSFVVVGMSLLGLQLSGCGGGGEGDSVTKSAPTIQELAKTDAAIASAAPDCPADYKKISINKSYIANATYSMQIGDATLRFKLPNTSIRVCFGIAPKPIEASNLYALSQTYDIKVYPLEAGANFAQLLERSLVINYGLTSLPPEMTSIDASKIVGVTDAQGGVLTDTLPVGSPTGQLDVVKIGAEKFMRSISPAGDGRYAVVYRP
jgi:hypothetical protein